MDNVSMNDDQKKVLAGAGSYVALIVMIWFTMCDAPAWMVPVVGIANGVLFTWVMGFLITFFAKAYKVLMMLHEIHRGEFEEEHRRMFDAYLAYIYDQSKHMSDMR